MQVVNVMKYEADHASAPGESPTPEAIRRAHGLTEACIKALGLLCLIDAIWLALPLFGSLAAPGTSPMALLVSAAWVIANARCGTWLRALDPRGRLLYTLMAIIHLAVFTYETFQAYAVREVSFQQDSQFQLTAGITLLLVRFAFLYVLWNRRGRMVTSQHFRDTIIPATSSIKHSRVPVLILLALLLIGAITAGTLILAR